jgi:hypothetical protein
MKGKEEKLLDNYTENVVKYQNSMDETHEIIPKENVAKFKKDGDLI